MWSKGEQLGVTPFRYSNHSTTKELDKVIYDINDEMYYFKGKYISPKAQQRLIDKLTAWGKELNGMSLQTEQNKRKEEALKQLREVYKKVYAYRPDDYPENVPQIQAMLKYSVGQYLRNKDKMTLEDNLKMMKDNKKLWFYNVEPLFAIKSVTPTLYTKSFVEMQKELFHTFDKLFIC